MQNIEKCVNILKRMGADALVLLDEANMHYLCGFSPSEGMVIILNNGDAFHLVDSRYTETAENHAKETGFKVIEFKTSYYEELAEIINDSKSKSIVYESNTISLKAFENIKKHCKDAQMVELGDLLMRERNRKDAEEIVMMKKANQIAEKAFTELLNHVKPGKTEKELAAYFDYLMAKEGSDGVSFDTILLAGERTSMPHGVPSENTIKSGEFVLFDFGATYQGYHSDMTRTVAVSSASDEMKEMYELVLNAQLAGIKTLNAGVKCTDVYKAAYEVLNEKNMAQYFRHGLGHGLGIEIHEGFNASPRSKDTYEVGNVTSIEPGIYIPGKFGIRIEDTILITKDKPVVLTESSKECIII